MRHSRESTVAGALVGRNGWRRDPYSVPGMVAHLARVNPDLPIVSDGPTAAGRGTTRDDLFRARQIAPGIVAHDMLSIKTGEIKGKGSKPSQVDLVTGNNALPAVLAGIFDHGASYHSLIWASRKSGDREGWAVMLDLAPHLREIRGAIPVSPSGGFGRGKAPAIYIKTQPRLSGIPGGNKAARRAVQAFEQSGTPLPPGKWYTRKDLDFPHVAESVDFRGGSIPLKVWENPYTVRYGSLHVSLHACGITQSDWTPMDAADLPAFVEAHNWGAF